MSHNRETSSISESELRCMIDNNNPQLDTVIHNMQLYNSNSIGSNAYFYKKGEN